MSKHDQLTEEEMSQHVFNPETLRVIEIHRKKLNLEKKDMRLLDWGCGRGRDVACLREKGYSAFGIDPDSVPINNGKELFVSRGIDHGAVLGLLDSDNRTPFQDEYFHFIFSEQVFEHINDLEIVSSEMARITAPGGGGHHAYPAHRCFKEGHLFMPVIHWLPKNILMKYLIRIFLFLGIDPGWKELNDKNAGEKADTYYKYMCNRTYYRHWNKISKIFTEKGFAVKFITLDNPNINTLKKLQKPLKIKLFRNIFYIAHLYFSPLLELSLTKIPAQDTEE